MPDCLVCGAENAKQHYGSWCCNGCKGFFWRSISSKRRYICLNRGSADLECKLEDGRRNCCRACRLKRCLEVGMDPNLIRDCWGRTTSQFIGGGAERSADGSMEDGGDRSPDTTSITSSNISPMSIIGIEKKPLLPSIMTPYHHHQSDQQTKPFTPCNLQLLSDYLEWVNCIPELNLLSEEDKNVMVLCRARPSAWLLLAHQQMYNAENRDKLELHKQELLHNEVLSPLLELDAHAIEFDILRNICFFSTVPQLSADGRRRVKSVQNAFVKMLSEFALKRVGLAEDAPSGGGGSLLNSVFRLNRIMHILSAVEKIAHLQE